MIAWATMSRIEEVENAHERGDVAQAVSLAVAVWRETRARAVADAVDRLAAKLERAPAPKFRTNKAFLEAWLAAVRTSEPGAVAWLCESLRTKLDRNDDEVFLRRLRAMQGVPDPRLACALMAVVEDGLDIARFCEDEIQKTLTIVGDERIRAALEAYVARLDDVDATSWRRVLENLPSGRVLEADERARWEALGDALPASTAVIVARDAEERAVLADALRGARRPAR